MDIDSTAVESLSKRHFDGNILNVGKAFFAIHKPRHWIAACIFFHEKRIVVYDSMKNAGEKGNEVFSNALLLFVRGQSEQNKEGGDTEGWELVTDPEGIGKQQNSYDCGVFVCMYAHYLMKQENLNFTQLDATAYRRKMKKIWTQALAN